MAAVSMETDVGTHIFHPFFQIVLPEEHCDQIWK